MYTTSLFQLGLNCLHVLVYAFFGFFQPRLSSKRVLALTCMCLPGCISTQVETRLSSNTLHSHHTCRCNVDTLYSIGRGEIRGGAGGVGENERYGAIPSIFLTLVCIWCTPGSRTILYDSLVLMHIRTSLERKFKVKVAISSNTK